MNELKAAIQRENESKEYYKAFLKEQKHRYYPNTMTLDLYMLFASHLNIGTRETLDFFKCLAEDVKTYPEFNGKGHFVGTSDALLSGNFTAIYELSGEILHSGL